jgi:glutamate carboxypeptidase
MSAESEWLAGQLAAMEQSLAALVEINSFTDNPEGGRKVGTLLKQAFAIDGLAAETVPSARYADHLVFRSTGDAGRPPLAILGHLDTVFPPGKFEGYRVDGELRRGPGVLDMKGGLVVIAWALKAIEKTVGLGKIAPLRIVVVADEEVGSPEGRPVIEKAIADCKRCFVFESGRANDAIVTQRKGTGAITVTAHGKAAHAGNNHADGANALWALARFVDKAQALTDYPRGVTVNVGKVTGGQGKNTVPDLAVAELDIRFQTRADADQLVNQLHEAAAASGASVAGTRLEVAGGPARLPMERSDASVALLNAYATHAKAHGLAADEAPRVGGGSDACTSSAMGIPSIDALGPRGKGFHTVDEYIEAKTLISRAQALADYLRAG